MVIPKNSDYNFTITVIEKDSFLPQDLTNMDINNSSFKLVKLDTLCDVTTGTTTISKSVDNALHPIIDYTQALEPYAEYINVLDTTAHNEWVGLTWEDTDTSTVYIYSKDNTTTENFYNYSWVLIDNYDYNQGIKPVADYSGVEENSAYEVYVNKLWKDSDDSIVYKYIKTFEGTVDYYNYNWELNTYDYNQSTMPYSEYTGVSDNAMHNTVVGKTWKDTSLVPEQFYTYSWTLITYDYYLPFMPFPERLGSSDSLLSNSVVGKTWKNTSTGDTYTYTKSGTEPYDYQWILNTYDYTQAGEPYPEAANVLDDANNNLWIDITWSDTSSGLEYIYTKVATSVQNVSDNTVYTYTKSGTDPYNYEWVANSWDFSQTTMPYPEYIRVVDSADNNSWVDVTWQNTDTGLEYTYTKLDNSTVSTYNYVWTTETYAYSQATMPVDEYSDVVDTIAYNAEVGNTWKDTDDGLEYIYTKEVSDADPNEYYNYTWSTAEYTQGRINIKLDSTLTNSLAILRGDAVDNYYLKPTYQGVINIKFTDTTPERTAIVDKIYVVPTGEVCA